MIAWAWLFAAWGIGVMAGMLVMCLFIAARADDRGPDEGPARTQPDDTKGE